MTQGKQTDTKKVQNTNVVEKTANETVPELPIAAADAHCFTSSAPLSAIRPGHILALQRTIGNRQVQNLIQRSKLADKILGTSKDNLLPTKKTKDHSNSGALTDKILGNGSENSGYEDDPLGSGIYVPPTLENLLLPDGQLPSKTKTNLESGDCLLGNIFFRTDEATLDNITDRAELDKLVFEMKRLMADGHRPQFEIIGYADPRYTDEQNQQLSMRRAESVKAYLEDLLGLHGLIIVTGSGEIKAYEGADPLTLAHARRVDIIDHALCHAQNKNDDDDNQPEDIPMDQITSVGTNQFDFRILGGIETKIPLPAEDKLPKKLRDLLKKKPGLSFSQIEMDVEFHDGANRVKQRFSLDMYVATLGISAPSSPVTIIKPSGPFPVITQKPILFCDIEGEVTLLDSTVLGQGGNGLEFLGPTPRITILMTSDEFKPAIEGKGGAGTAVRKGGQIRAGSGGVNWHDC